MRYISILCSAIILCFMSCAPITHETIPYEEVNFTIYPNDAEYSNLMNYGGYVYVTGGVAGIIIYRLDLQTFMAYDRACPYDWSETTERLVVNEDGITISHAYCGSLFNILDGSIIDGPSKYNLLQYRTFYDGNKLKVYN